MSILLKRRPANPDLDLPESLHPLLQQIFRQRGVHSAEELHLGLEHLLTPDLLLGMESAVGLLEQALRQQRRLLIVCDFDADGATSCVLAMIRALLPINRTIALTC
jgi:single-stranded-DNA-specific exonuclease